MGAAWSVAFDAAVAHAGVADRGGAGLVVVDRRVDDLPDEQGVRAQVQPVTDLAVHPRQRLVEHTRVSPASHKLTVNDPPAAISRRVIASLSTATPISTGAIDSWLTQLAVIALRSSPAREPIRTSALGTFQVTLLSSSSSTAMPAA